MEQSSIPQYSIRGHNIWGFKNMSHFLDYLFADGKTKTGTLVAINAEKVMIAEQDTALNTLLGQAEYLYADGISIVRAIRRKYPKADVSRVAGADLWEGLMERAGKEGTPVFLVGESLKFLNKLKRSYVRNGM